MDELDLWNRALTDVEIAAIYQAGTNHIGKATPVSILPNCDILLNGVTNTTLIAPGRRHQLADQHALFHRPRLQHHHYPAGQSLGHVVRRFRPANPGQFQLRPARRTAGPLHRPKSLWLLDAGCLGHAHRLAAPTNGVLLSWNLQMTVSSTNVSLIVLTNHIPYIAGTVAANSITYFAFDVPADAFSTTNTLFNCKQWHR